MRWRDTSFFGSKMRKELSEILKKIEESGEEAFLVGGYPRDWILGRECLDYDICTSASTEELKSIFSEILEENFGCLKVRYQLIGLKKITFLYGPQSSLIQNPYGKICKGEILPSIQYVWIKMVE